MLQKIFEKELLLKGYSFHGHSDTKVFQKVFVIFSLGFLF